MKATVGKQAVDLVRGRLAERFAESVSLISFPEGFIAVPKADGAFQIEIVDEGEEATISAGAWHEHFDDPRAEFSCFMWLTTPYYRLVEAFRDGEIAWAMTQRYTDHGWEDIGTPVVYGSPDGGWDAWRNGVFDFKIYQQALDTPKDFFLSIFLEAKLDSSGLPLGSVLGVREVFNANIDSLVD